MCVAFKLLVRKFDLSRSTFEGKAVRKGAQELEVEFLG